MQASGRVSLVGFRMGGPGAPLTQAVADLGRGASGAGEIKREEQEGEENLAAEHEEEKKEPKAPRARTRCRPHPATPQRARAHAQGATGPASLSPSGPPAP